eukprot:gene18908-20811_t
MAKLHVADSIADLHKEFGQFILQQSKFSIDDHGYFSIGLSGGSSATIVSKALTSDSVFSELDWKKFHVFFCDERHVSLTDPDSNYNALKANLFEKVPIPEKQVYKTDPDVSLQDAAFDYEARMRSLFGDVQFPSFDALIVGMGPDGHICSLFPEHSLLDESSKWVASIADSPKPPPDRITLTLPVLNHAKAVCFTVTGAGKAEMVKQAIINPQNNLVPASMVDVTRNNVHWFLDKDAASQLE